MRERLCRWALAAVALALCALFAAGLLAYAHPMEAEVYDLSLAWEGEAVPADWVFSDKGWTVFTREGAEQRELSPDGLGGYTLCTKLGYNVLLPDQRAHGYSGGHTITMGVKERYDARDWAVWARSHFGPEVPIFLMGVSMGAATVLLAAGLNLPDNVCGIVADCGYTSPREITRKCLPEYLPGFPLGPTYAIGRLGAILFGHFDPEDADCTDAAAHSKVPIFFVHGDADDFVPYEMGRRNYEVCRAKGKRFLTVHGAEHAVSYYHDNTAYTKECTDFLQDCLTRRHFAWPKEAPDDAR